MIERAILNYVFFVKVIFKIIWFVSEKRNCGFQNVLSTTLVTVRRTNN